MIQPHLPLWYSEQVNISVSRSNSPHSQKLYILPGRRQCKPLKESLMSLIRTSSTKARSTEIMFSKQQSFSMSLVERDRPKTNQISLNKHQTDLHILYILYMKQTSQNLSNLSGPHRHQTIRKPKKKQKKHKNL